LHFDNSFKLLMKDYILENGIKDGVWLMLKNIFFNVERMKIDESDLLWRGWKWVIFVFINCYILHIWFYEEINNQFCILFLLKQIIRSKYKTTKHYLWDLINWDAGLDELATFVLFFKIVQNKYILSSNKSEQNTQILDDKSYTKLLK